MKSTTTAVQEIWNLIKETNQQIKKLSSETDKLRASQKDTDQQVKEASRGLKKAKELFETQWGRLMESLVEGGLEGVRSF